MGEQRANHHPNIASQGLLTEEIASCIDQVFMDRWRCLMSVDDLIEEVFKAVEEAGVMDSTYFFYSSDHGFQLGELNLPFDKRNVYEFDAKIHLLARGPGIAEGSQWAQPATNVDLAPTWLAIAGLRQPAGMDGRSILPLLLDAPASIGSPAYKTWSATLPATVHEHLLAVVGLDTYASTWRKSVYIHHQHVGGGGLHICPGHNGHQVDDVDNNYIAVRHLPGSPLGNILYAEFQWANGTNYGAGNVDFQSPFFFEYFDLDNDPWQMENIYGKVKSSDPQLIARLHEEVQAWLACSGISCTGEVPPSPPVPPAPPAPPTPTPKGLALYIKDGLCLKCANDCGQEGESLTLGACGGREAIWNSSVDVLHFPQIASASNAELCLNVAARKCKAGATVHLHTCQESDSKVHLSNHFSFDSDSGTIRSTYCDDEHGGNVCLSSDFGSDGGLVLADCAATSAAGVTSESPAVAILL